MNVFGKLFKARDKPRNSLNGSGYSFLFGNTVAGKTVNERSAMQMSAVYACVRILSEAIAALPLHFYQYNAAGGKEKALRHPLYNLLHDEPNPEMTAFSFRETLMTHLLLWGNGYAQIVRNQRGEVIALVSADARPDERGSRRPRTHLLRIHPLGFGREKPGQEVLGDPFAGGRFSYSRSGL